MSLNKTDHLRQESANAAHKPNVACCLFYEVLLKHSYTHSLTHC